jgi:integrase
MGAFSLKTYRRHLVLSGHTEFFSILLESNRLSAKFQEDLGDKSAPAGVRYFRLYDLRSTHATRLSAGGVADEWVTQMLRQTDAKVFKKYSQMKLQMKREALARLNRKANEPQPDPGSDTGPEQ